MSYTMLPVWQTHTLLNTIALLDQIGSSSNEWKTQLHVLHTDRLSITHVSVQISADLANIPVWYTRLAKSCKTLQPVMPLILHPQASTPISSVSRIIVRTAEEHSNDWRHLWITHDDFNSAGNFDAMTTTISVYLVLCLWRDEEDGPKGSRVIPLKSATPKHWEDCRAIYGDAIVSYWTWSYICFPCPDRLV
jgi:hypothetical protein